MPNFVSNGSKWVNEEAIVKTDEQKKHKEVVEKESIVPISKETISIPSSEKKKRGRPKKQ